MSVCLYPDFSRAETLGSGAAASLTEQGTPAFPSEHHAKCHPDHEDTAVRVHIIPLEQREHAAALPVQALPNSVITTPQDYQPPPPPPDMPEKVSAHKGKKVCDHPIKGKASSEGSGKEVGLSVEVNALRDEVRRHFANVAHEEDLVHEHPVTQIASELEPITQMASKEDPVTRIVAHSRSAATEVASRQDPITRMASLRLASSTHVASQGDQVTRIASMQLVQAPEDLRVAAVGSVATVRASRMQLWPTVPTNNHAPSNDSVETGRVQSECVVCLVRRARMALVPCGHKCVCQDCVQILRDAGAGCPLCRREMQDAILIFD